LSAKNHHPHIITQKHRLLLLLFCYNCIHRRQLFRTSAYNWMRKSEDYWIHPWHFLLAPIATYFSDGVVPFGSNSWLKIDLLIPANFSAKIHSRLSVENGFGSWTESNDRRRTLCFFARPDMDKREIKKIKTGCG
jgi:hypothetical protein